MTTRDVTEPATIIRIHVQILSDADADLLRDKNFQLLQLLWFNVVT